MGKTLVVLSSGALLQCPRLFENAEAANGQILVPSGALGGLDIVMAMSEGFIQGVTPKLPSLRPVYGILNTYFNRASLLIA